MKMSLILSAVAVIVPSAIIFISIILSSGPYMMMPDREKSSPFECGFDPKNTARLPFSTRYFLLAVIFLVFDIEIILLMPIPIALLMNMMLAAVVAGSLFLIILILGLIHEWHEGSLNWN